MSTHSTISLATALLFVAVCSAFAVADDRPEPDPETLIYLLITPEEITIAQTPQQVAVWHEQVTEDALEGTLLVVCQEMKLEGAWNGQQRQTTMQFSQVRFFIEEGRVSGHAETMQYDSASHTIALKGTERQPVVITYEADSGDELRCSALQARINLKGRQVQVFDSGRCDFFFGQSKPPATRAAPGAYRQPDYSPYSIPPAIRSPAIRSDVAPQGTPFPTELPQQSDILPTDAARAPAPYVEPATNPKPTPYSSPPAIRSEGAPPGTPLPNELPQRIETLPTDQAMCPYFVGSSDRRAVYYTPY